MIPPGHMRGQYPEYFAPQQQINQEQMQQIKYISYLNRQPHSKISGNHVPNEYKPSLVGENLYSSEESEDYSK
jgi:hypothetical protein